VTGGTVSSATGADAHAGAEGECGVRRLALGPVLYHWPRDVMFRFYETMADAPVDVIYLGEVVCSKRRALTQTDWLALASELEVAGKQVVLSTLALIEAGSELGAVRSICENGRFMVEANDMSAVQMLAAAGTPFVTGPGVNIYNSRTLEVLARCGLKRWVMPVELSGSTLHDIHAGRPPGVETEVFAYGRLPLAYSARCYTARARNLPKDQCGFCCREDPDGLLLRTREDEAFLVLNGTQTQSARTFTLAGELADIGAQYFRLSPQSQHMSQIIEFFAARLAGGQGPACEPGRLYQYMPTGPCNGYWNGTAGLQQPAGACGDA
jgi:collagenase-like PrtC family protease